MKLAYSDEPAQKTKTIEIPGFPGLAGYLWVRRDSHLAEVLNCKTMLVY